MSLARCAIIAFMAAVCICTFLHALSVALINSPAGNPLRTAFAVELRRYGGPWLYQRWSLFAPAAAEYNNELFVRGKTSSGKMTPWLNVSEYYVKRGWNDPLFREHYVSEAVSHALDFAFAPKQRDRDAARVILFNAAARILCLYTAGKNPNHMQAEIDRTFVISIPPQKPQQHRVEDTLLGWRPVSC